MSESIEEKLDRVRLMASGDPTWDLSPNDLETLRHVLAELGRMQAIVDRLPKTADGVPIVPGGDYWSNNDRGTFQWSVVELHQTAASGTFHGSPCVYESYDECYSTREAAEKARHG